MEAIARVYAQALFEVAKGKARLDEIREQLGLFTDAVDRNRDLTVFFFSPYFSSAEKQDAIRKAIAGAEPEFINFLELLVEKHRMPVIFRIRRHFDALWARERRQLEVTLTSAVELDREVVERVRREIAEKTDRNIRLHTQVDEGILGGLVLQVGNMVLDASIRNRLERLRKEVAQAA